jgi:hypothetical protein
MTAGGPAVASVDCTTSGILRIVQEDMLLEPKHLQLASSKGRSSAGSHGEGVYHSNYLSQAVAILQDA